MKKNVWKNKDKNLLRILNRYDSPDWIYYGNDHWYKIRTVFEASRRLQQALDIHQKFLAGPWNKWFEDCSTVKIFYGLTKEYYSIYEVSDRGYSHNHINRKNPSASEMERVIQMAENADLPLMLEDPKYQDYKSLIEKRFNGKLQPIVRRQDLVKEHKRLELRLDHIRSVISTYRMFLQDYVMRKFRDKIYDKYRRSLIVILNVEGHLYHYYVGRSDNDLELADLVEYHTVKADEKCAIKNR
jgi:hypothetical protein